MGEGGVVEQVWTVCAFVCGRVLCSVDCVCVKVWTAVCRL